MVTEEIKPIPDYSRWGVLKVDQFKTEHQAAFRAAKKRVKYRQEEGDDGYCYVLRVDGRSCYAGLDRRSAQHEADRAILHLMNGRPWHGRP